MRLTQILDPRSPRRARPLPVLAATLLGTVGFASLAIGAGATDADNVWTALDPNADPVRIEADFLTMISDGSHIGCTVPDTGSPFVTIAFDVTQGTARATNLRPVGQTSPCLAELALAEVRDSAALNDLSDYEGQEGVLYGVVFFDPQRVGSAQRTGKPGGQTVTGTIEIPADQVSDDFMETFVEADIPDDRDAQPIHRPSPMMLPGCPGLDVSTVEVTDRWAKVGQVKLRFDVDAAGTPRNIEVTSSSASCFDQPARDTVATWEYAKGRELTGVETMVVWALTPDEGEAMDAMLAEFAGGR